MRKYHFIGSGERIIYDFALSLHQKGFQVTSNDDIVDVLLKSNTKIKKLPSEKIDTDLDGIILGPEVRRDNPELQKAIEVGVRIYSYAEFLFEQSREKTRVVIGGSAQERAIIIAIVLHVLNYWNKDVDYIINTQIKDFNTKVYLTDSNDFILIEGDDNPSSILDNKPNFLWYKPHIALISRVKGKPDNTFLTEQNYIEQLEKYIDCIVPGGILIYNASDEIVSKIAQETQNTIRKEVYKTPSHFVNNGVNYLKTVEGDLPLDFLNTHSVDNVATAKWACQLMGIDESDFLEAISSFKGKLIA